MSEHTLQCAVASLLNRFEYHGKLFWYHPPNSIYTSKSQAGKHKAAGMKAGVPDCCLVLPGGVASFIELKYGKNGLSQPQSDVRKAVQELGSLYFVIKSNSVMDAVAQLRDILRDLGVGDD